jgi:hypothetical protein
MEINNLQEFEINNLNEFIKTFLIYYDNQNIKYHEYLNNNISKINIDNNVNTIIIKNNKNLFKGSYEILAMFDYQTNIWQWSWIIYNINSQLTNISKDLLNYGLKLEPSNNYINTEHTYIKSFLVNSKIQIGTDVELYTNLALVSYLLKDQIKFIFNNYIYLDDNKTKSISYFYLIY